MANYCHLSYEDRKNIEKPSFYYYVNNGVFEFGPLDFPRIVKFKTIKNSNKRGYLNLYLSLN